MHRTTTPADDGAPSASVVDPRRAARQGVAAMLPLVVGYVPFALVIGATAAELGHPLAGWAGSWLIYGGSAHLTTMTTLDDAGLFAAVVTGLLVNARLLLYSASFARRWSAQPAWFRVLGSALIIDPTWAVAQRDDATVRDDRSERAFFVAAGLTLGLAWSAAMGVGAILGGRIDGADLDVVVPLCMVALVAPALRRIDTALVIVVAGGVALATASWTAGTGLLAAIVAGSAAGLMFDGAES